MNTQLEQIDKQMNMADAIYQKTIKSLTIEKIKKMKIEDKMIYAHFIGTVIEQYLKALLVWKGKTWIEVRHIGHKLGALYRCLDDEGKKILLNMFNNKLTVKKNQGCMIESYNDDNIYPNGLNTTKFSLINGCYDGNYDFPDQLSQDTFNLTHLETVLNKINVPSLRYSVSDYNLTDKEFIMLLNLSRNLNVLSKIARGQKQRKRRIQPK